MPSDWQRLGIGLSSVWVIIDLAYTWGHICNGSKPWAMTLRVLQAENVHEVSWSFTPSHPIAFGLLVALPILLMWIAGIAFTRLFKGFAI